MCPVGKQSFLGSLLLTESARGAGAGARPDPERELLEAEEQTAGAATAPLQAALFVFPVSRAVAVAATAPLKAVPEEFTKLLITHVWEDAYVC